MAPAPARPGVRADVAAGAIAVALVALATGVGVYLSSSTSVQIFAATPPLFAVWQPHLGPGTPLALLVAVLVVARGPAAAQHLPWRRALAATYLAALAWTFALAMIDGWRAGFAGRLTTADEYLHEVPGIDGIPAMLRGFSARILDHQPDSWTTHVAGHPPGATLVFVWLDRAGLGGGGWAAAVCVLVGCLAAVAVPVTLAALGSPDLARAAMPFAVLFPGAVWLAVSADGLFAGVAAGGIALFAVGASGGAAAGRRLANLALCAAGGVLLGFCVFLSYGLVLLAVPVLVIGVLHRNWPALAVAAAAAALVAAVFAAAGFSWFEGYHLVVQRYYQGIANSRPYEYWVWANLAALVLCGGPAMAAGLCRALLSRALPAGRSRAVALVLAVAVAVAAADLSGLSKAEVERIWLPFAVWLTASAALLPAGSRRWWLAAQALTALLVNHLLLTNW